MRRFQTNYDQFMTLLEEAKGPEVSWRSIEKKIGVDHSTISRIKAGTYSPGYRTIAKLACMAPDEKRKEFYQQLLHAAGLGRIGLCFTGANPTVSFAELSEIHEYRM